MNEFDPQHLNLAQTDPQLDALLDEALAPGEVPAGLNQRIIAATVDQLPQHHAPETDSPVIGRISSGSQWRAAAVLLLLASVCGAFFAAFNSQDNQNYGMPFVGGPNVADLETVQEGLDQLADAALQAEPIDDDIAMLSMQLSATQTPGFWEQDALDSLDNAIAFETFDELQDELDLYF